MLIDDFLLRSARLYPRTVAVDDGREALTFEALAQRVARLARGLSAEGVQPGERVALLAKNRVDYLALYFAAARIGAVLVPLNWRLRAQELGWILRDCPPRVLIAEPEFAVTLERALEGHGAPPSRFRFGSAEGDWRSFAQLAGRLEVTASTPRTGDEAPREDEVAVQMYTSGTTGHPKGAMLTQANLTAVTRAWLLDMRLDPEASRFLQVTPLFHVGGLLMALSTVAAGCTLALLPEFEPVAAIEALATDGITHTLMVPAMIQWVLLEPSLTGRDFPDLQLVVYGASPMPTAVLQRAFEVFGCDFLQGYGLTETGGVLLTLTPADHRFDPGEEPPARLAAAGRALFGSTVRVVDQHGDDVAVGEVGEIVARGDNITPGYFGNPEATAHATRDGWFHTGDLARVDAEGFVYVVDRLTDMILVGGENVYPREVEEVLMGHEAVADAAVIGIPHEVWGEEVLALVVLRVGATTDGRALVRHCRAALARFKCPTRVELVESLPRNAAGKLQKRDLRESHWAGRSRRV